MDEYIFPKKGENLLFVLCEEEEEEEDEKEEESLADFLPRTF